MGPKVNKNKEPSKFEKKNRIKLLIVKKIGECKESLFASFSATITKETKAAKWQEIVDYATSVGFENNGNWQYFRDTTWNNWKKAAVTNWDKANHTGAGGGEELELTELDEAILDVIGRESASLIGIAGARESLEVTKEVEAAVSSIPNPASSASSIDRSVIVIESRTDEAPPHTVIQNRSTAPKPNKRPAKDSAHSQVPLAQDSSLEELKKKKATLQVAHLEMINYKTQLEIFELENRLGFGHKYPVDTPRSLDLLHYGDDNRDFENDYSTFH